jgi:uncharacterized protein YbaR (Trm112 family)
VILRKIAFDFLGLFFVDKKLLSILVCPVTKAPLEFNATTNELVCRVSGLAYPIRDGIPVMLEAEARQLDADEKLKLKGS